MKDKNIHIERFIAAMSQLYPWFSFGYTRSEEEWIIWHTNEKEITDIEFRNSSGELMYSILWENDVYDVSFEYNISKDLKEFSAMQLTRVFWDFLPQELCNIKKNLSMVDWARVYGQSGSTVCIPESTALKSETDNKDKDKASDQGYSLAA